MLDETAKDRKKERILVIYDVVCDKRRRYIVKTLEGYGQRVQKSAFELYLNQKQARLMTTQLSRYIDEQEDSLRIYILHANSKVNCWGKDVVKLDEIIVI